MKTNIKKIYENWYGDGATINYTKVSVDDCEIDDSGILERCNNQGKHLILPEGIKAIGKNLFLKNDHLVSVVIPEGVTAIHKAAFKGCTKLEHIHLPKTLEILEASTLMYCESLKTIDFPDSIEEIPYGTLEECSSLTTIIVPPKVKKIGPFAFRKCTSVKSIELADNMESIAAKAFFGCESLESITLPSSIKEIKNDLFTNCQSLRNLVIPSSVRKIGEGAFENCYSLRSIEFSSEVKSIGKYAFASCIRLSELELPPLLDELSQGLFYRCRSLERVVVPNKVKKIAKYVFWDCDRLKEIVIPTSVKSIMKQKIDEDDRDNIYIESGYRIRHSSYIGSLPKEDYNMLGTTNHEIVLRVASGSFAESFAKEHNLNYVIEQTQDFQKGGVKKSDQSGRTVVKKPSAARNVPKKTSGQPAFHYDISKYEGMHDVTEASERILIFNRFTVEVPAGYSYSMDEIINSQNTDDEYDVLRVQRTEDRNMAKNFASAFSFHISGEIFGVSPLLLRDDIKSQSVVSQMEELFDVNFKEFEALREEKQKTMEASYGIGSPINASQEPVWLKKTEDIVVAYWVTFAYDTWGCGQKLGL